MLGCGLVASEPIPAVAEARYRAVLGVEVAWLDDVVRAKRPARLPVVLTCDEVAAVLQHLQRVKRLVAASLYGSGLDSSGAFSFARRKGTAHARRCSSHG